MSGLIVGGIPIPTSAPGIKRDRLDGVDRARAYDNSYRASQTGNPKRDWFFSTPPVPRGSADYYHSILSTVTAQLCAGDVIGNNQLLWPDTFSNAAWTKFNCTLTQSITDQLGISPAYTMTATGAAAFIQQTLSASSSLVRTNSIWVRRRTGTGTVQLRAPDGVTTTITLTANWQRFSMTGAASTGRDFVLFVNTSGDAVDISDAQLEDGATMSTYSSNTTIPAPVSCCSEITDWQPVQTQGGHCVILSFSLHEV